MNKIQRQVAKSSFGSKAATAARASVSTIQVARVINRASQMRAEKGQEKRAPK